MACLLKAEEFKRGNDMKVLVLSQYWYPENGVPQRRWRWLTELLRQSGHEVYVLTPPPHYAREETLKDWIRNLSSKKKREMESGVAGENILRTWYFPAGQSLTLRAANQFSVGLGMLKEIYFNKNLNRWSPDVVIGTVPALPTSFITFLTSKRFNVPYIVDLRDAWPDLLQQSKDWNRAIDRVSLREKIGKHGILQIVIKLTELFLNVSLRNAENIIVTSENLRDHIELRSNSEGWNTKQVVCVRNVFPSSGMPNENRKQFEDDCHQTRPLRLLYAGTVGRAQNLTNALHALKIANDQGSEIELRIVGAGAGKTNVVKLAREMDLSVEVCPQCPPQEMQTHYEWADTSLVHLTNWKQLERAVPSKTYELMSNRIHITGSVAGETADLIKDLDAGHVVEPEDPSSLSRLLVELSKEREKLRVSNTGSNWVEEQRTKIAPQRFLQLFGNVKK